MVRCFLEAGLWILQRALYELPVITYHKGGILQFTAVFLCYWTFSFFFFFYHAYILKVQPTSTEHSSLQHKNVKIFIYNLGIGPPIIATTIGFYTSFKYRQLQSLAKSSNIGKCFFQPRCPLIIHML